MGYPIPKDTRLRGPFQPMRFESTVEECIVSEGEIPKELAGGFYRTGPTWKRPSKQGTNGLLALDGMVQGITFENGRADFRNRWIRTPKYLLEERHERGMFNFFALVHAFDRCGRTRTNQSSTVAGMPPMADNRCRTHVAARAVTSAFEDVDVTEPSALMGTSP